jgi:hypothetical protein
VWEKRKKRTTAVKSTANGKIITNDKYAALWQVKKSNLNTRVLAHG